MASGVNTWLTRATRDGHGSRRRARILVTDNPETAVVLVTGEDDPLVADRAFDLGVHGYVVEPLQLGQLLTW
jgi:AmiR/NasT family two-component response regulator